MILSGPEICRLVELTRRDPGRLPAVEIDPFDPARAGPNSYDLTLGPKLLVYRGGGPLDLHADDPTDEILIPAGGLVLTPGVLYLGATVERTRAAGLVPRIDGRSSVGRKGVSVHVTAGFGDDGFDGRWTIEVTAVRPVRVYAGDRVCQLVLTRLEGERKPYRGRYQSQAGPVASRFHEG